VSTIYTYELRIATSTGMASVIPKTSFIAWEMTSILRAVVLAKADDQDELLKPEYLGDVYLESYSFPFQGVPDEPEKRQITIFCSDNSTTLLADGTSVKLAKNVKMNKLLTKICTDDNCRHNHFFAALRDGLRGKFFVCFTDPDDGGVWCADMPTSTSKGSREVIVSGILRAEATRLAADAFLYEITRITTDMQDVGSVGHVHVSACIKSGLKKEKLTLRDWLRMKPLTEGHVFLSKYIAGLDGRIVSEDGIGEPTERELVEFYDAATGIIRGC